MIFLVLINKQRGERLEVVADVGDPSAQPLANSRCSRFKSIGGRSARDFALTEISFETYSLGKLKTCETLRAEKTPSSNSSKGILLKYFQSRDTCTIILGYVRIVNR